jgi:hypothetical protein
MPLRRCAGLLLIVCSCVATYLLYVRAPWYLDPSAFVQGPVLLFTVPLLVIGLDLCLNPGRLWVDKPWAFWLYICLLSGFGLLVSSPGGPTPASGITQEEWFRVVTVPTMLPLLALLGIPFWLLFVVSTLKVRMRKNTA